MVTPTTAIATVEEYYRQQVSFYYDPYRGDPPNDPPLIAFYGTLSRIAEVVQSVQWSRMPEWRVVTTAEERGMLFLAHLTEYYQHIKEQERYAAAERLHSMRVFVSECTYSFDHTLCS